MQVTTSDGGAERAVLIAAITRKELLARVVGKVDKEPFASHWSNVVWGWCDRYYRRHLAAPGKAIESLFKQWSAKAQDTDTIKLVERFLASLSSEHERKDPLEISFLLDMTEKLLNDVRLMRLEEELRLTRTRGNTEGAITSVDSFRKVNLHSPAFIEVVKDREALANAYRDEQHVLVRYPGPAGDFFGSELSADSFVAFMAPPKGAKSQLLLDVAWRAFRGGSNTAYFQVGDLSTNQIMRRFLLRAAYRPIGRKMIRFPVGILRQGNSREPAMVEHEDRVFEQPITWGMAEAAFDRVAKTAKAELRLSRHIIGSASIHDIRGILEAWDKEGWRSEVIIIDYAENLAPVNPKSPGLEQIAATWSGMRELSEMRKCLVVTASQTNKEGFKTRWVLTRQNFRGNLMTLAHVTAFLGINQTDEEKALGLLRLNFVVRRGEGFSETRCLWAAPCLDISNPIVVSTL